MKLNCWTKATPGALSWLLVVLVGVWAVAAVAFNLSNRESKDGIWGASVPTLAALSAVLVLLPILVPWLVRARRSEGQRFTAFDRFAVVLAASPYLFVAGLIAYVFLRR